MRTAHLLREARRRGGLTQQELADRVGTSQSAVARWESGRVRPSLETLETLVRACDLELDLALFEPDESELALLDQTLALTPTQRLDQLTRTVSFIRAGRRELERSR